MSNVTFLSSAFIILLLIFIINFILENSGKPRKKLLPIRMEEGTIVSWFILRVKPTRSSLHEKAWNSLQQKAWSSLHEKACKTRQY